MFLGKLNPTYQGFPDLNWRERLTLYPLGALVIVLGFYPQAVLGVINPTLHRSSRGSGRSSPRTTPGPPWTSSPRQN